MKHSNWTKTALAATTLAILTGVAVAGRGAATDRWPLPIEARSNAALRSFAGDAATQLAMQLVSTRPQPLRDADTVRVVVVKSMMTPLNWLDDLASDWASFGDLPIVFDLSLMQVGSFDLYDLRRLDPDAIWIASPTAGKYEFSSSEEQALRTIQENDGITIVGTGLVFGGAGFYDNRHLGGLFGIDTSNRVFVASSDSTRSMSFKLDVPAELADSLPIGPLFTVAYKQRAERESSRGWDDDQMTDGRIVALGNTPEINSIEVYVERDRGKGIYFSAPHEFKPAIDPDRNDAQLLYNAFTIGLVGQGDVGGDVQVDGEPFAFRPIFLADGTIGCTYRERTDSTGAYAFDGVPEGTYSLEIPNIVHELGAGPHDEGVMIADGAIEINGVAADGITVYGVRIDTLPIQIVGPDITDITGVWELEIPDWGQWLVWAPGIGVVAR